MKSITFLIVFIVVLMTGSLIGGYFWGRSTTHKPVIITEGINIDSLQNVLLQGKVDILTHQEALQLNEDIKDKLRRLQATAGLHGRDTTYLHDSLYFDFAVIKEKYHVWSGDTTLNVDVNGYAIQEKDTTRFNTKTAIDFSVAFVGDSINAFLIRKIKVRPFTIDVPLKERVIDTGAGFRAYIVGGVTHGEPAAGMLFQIDRFGAGAMAVSQGGTMLIFTYRMGN